MSAASLPVKLVRLALRGVLRLLFRVRVEGLERLPDGQMIVCANHLGWTDPFLLLLCLPVEPRLYALGERAGVLRNSWRTWIINGLRVMVPLDRDRPDAAMAAMGDVLARRGSLIIFPEGCLGDQEGALRPLRTGAARLSLRSGVPIVPIGLTGTRELWLRRPLTLRIGEPIYPSVAGDTNADSAIGMDNADTTPRSITSTLDEALRALLPGDDAHPRCKPLRRWLTALL